MQDSSSRANENFYSQLVKNSQWYGEYHPFVRGVQDDWRYWLHSRRSLTEQLIEHSNHQFRVKVLSQRWGKPLLFEANSLQIPMHLAVRIREVELQCAGKTMVFARTIMPLKVYLQQRHILANIGSRPLGHLLFKEGQIHNSQRRVSVYNSAQGQTVFGRSTPYRYASQQILVSEFFINSELQIRNRP